MIDYRDDNKWTVYVHIVPKDVSGNERDKYYVGVTCQDMCNRWGNGSGILYKKCKRFFEAIQLFGWDNLQHEIIASNLTESEAYDLEKKLIFELKSYDNKFGYNMSLGGQGLSPVTPRIILDYERDDKNKTVPKDFMTAQSSLFYLMNQCQDFEKFEIWKPVVGYEGLYEVSNFGRVKSLDRWVRHGGKKSDYTLALKKGKMLSPKDNGHGYKSVHLTVSRKTKDFYIHRLVAMAFIPNPDGLPEVNHKDENTSNNCVDNLEWCTPKYNSNYGNHRIKIGRPVIMYDHEGNYVDDFISAAEAKKITGAKGITAVCNGKRRTAGGYIWKYKDNVEDLSAKIDPLDFYKRREIAMNKKIVFGDIELFEDEEITEETLAELSNNKGDEE